MCESIEWLSCFVPAGVMRRKVTVRTGLQNSFKCWQVDNNLSNKTWKREREQKCMSFSLSSREQKLVQTFAGYSSTQASSTSREKHEKQFKTSWDRFCWDENANPPLSFFFFSALAYSKCRGTKGLLSVRLPSRCRLRAFPISKKILTTQTCYYSRRNARRARDYFWPSSRSNWREISFLHSDLPLRLRFRHRFQKLASRSSVSDSRPTDRVKGKKGGYRCELVFRGHVCTIFSLHSLSFT